MLKLRQWGHDAVAVAGGEMKPSACAIWTGRW